MASLNPRQLKFVERYLATGNATQSYIDAYPDSSRKAAEANAARLIRDDRVQQLVAPAQQQAQKQVEQETTEAITRVVITRDRIREELAKLAFVNPKRFFNSDGTPRPIHELDDDTAAALAGFEVEEVWEAVETSDELEAQPNGGALKRRRGPQVVVRTKKFKLWDKNRALVSLGNTEPGVWAGVKEPGHTTNVNVAVMSDAELARRIDALEGGVVPATSPERLLEVVAAEPAEVQLEVAAPVGDSAPPSAGD